jgi:hypothetical protein
MQKILKIVILFVGISNFKNTAAAVDLPVRLTCQESRAMAATAGSAIKNLMSILIRVRELAQESMNSSLGATDRGYLDSERAQLINEADRIINQTNMHDTFGQNYFLLRDGIQFSTLVQSRMGGEEFPMTFVIEPIVQENFGRIDDHDVFRTNIATIATAEDAYAHLKAALTDLRLRQAWIGLIIDACPN